MTAYEIGREVDSWMDNLDAATRHMVQDGDEVLPWSTKMWLAGQAAGLFPMVEQPT